MRLYNCNIHFRLLVDEFQQFSCLIQLENVKTYEIRVKYTRHRQNQQVEYLNAGYLACRGRYCILRVNNLCFG